MPIYEFSCRSCGQARDFLTRTPPTCTCGDLNWKRKFSFTVAGGDLRFEPHFNHSVGRVVHSSKDFDSALSAAGDKAGSVYSRVEPGDMMGQMKDAPGIEEQAKAHRDSGEWRKSGIGKPSKSQVIA